MTCKLNRNEFLERIRHRSDPWDLVVIGGGATGVGIAMDAASRGLAVLLLERSDFGSGTSSRSTKLVHGGVRYLKQGNITLVRDALRERSLLKENAPNLVFDKPFLIPCANLWQWFFYGVGLKLYDLLATGNKFGRSRLVSSNRALEIVPGLNPDRLRGAVVYHDGQFDDARLLVSMAQTAADYGAVLLNYAAAESLQKNDRGEVCGVIAKDRESGEQIEIASRAVVNAAGPFGDQVRRMDKADCEPMIAASQGVHLVLPKELFPGETAMIVPKTSDGRVIFIVPWHDHAIVGTTDTAIPEAVAEPTPQQQEIEFLLETAGLYLTRQPTIDDVLSVFTGIRPLVKGDKSSRTASLSRDHVIRVASSKLITITGGKWTTVRKMAEDCVDRVVDVAGLTVAPCGTERLSILSSDESDLRRLEEENPALKQTLHETLGLKGSDVVYAVRCEMARTVEDVLARRSRALFLNAKAALEVAPAVAELMSQELGTDESWRQAQIQSFESVAQHYLPCGLAKEGVGL